MSQLKPKDYQRTVELINKYILSSTQFLNRFAATVDMKLTASSRQLQRLESQVVLLERKLDSIDNDGAPAPKAEPAPLAIADKPAAPPGLTNGLPPGVSAPPGNKAPPPPPGMKTAGAPPLPPGVSGPKAVPPPPGMGGRPGAPPPPPGSKQPPLPPGVAAPAGGAAPLALMPPPMPGAPPPGAPAPPPPPMAAASGTATRNHPKLAGYFKMQEGGVPVVAIKQKMQSDGYNPDWFDTPDAPAPLAAVAKPANGRTEYDSD